MIKKFLTYNVNNFSLKMNLHPQKFNFMNLLLIHIINFIHIYVSVYVSAYISTICVQKSLICKALAVPQIDSRRRTFSKCGKCDISKCIYREIKCGVCLMY